LDSLVGRRVGVRGRIVSYRGRVEIVLEHEDQIVRP
jgi:DNA/RNA endonuclease YhcR with UshA esterase domain